MEKSESAKLTKKMQKSNVLEKNTILTASFAEACDFMVTRERLAKVQAAVDVHSEAAPFFTGVFFGSDFSAFVDSLWQCCYLSDSSHRVGLDDVLPGRRFLRAAVPRAGPLLPIFVSAA